MKKSINLICFLFFVCSIQGQMFMNSSGSVGVGTNSPDTKLHVKHSSSGESFSNVTGLLVENNGNRNDHYVFQTATAGVGKCFSITNAGNVGIGDDTPNQKLDVAGNISMGNGRYLLPRKYKNSFLMQFQKIQKAI